MSMDHKKDEGKKTNKLSFSETRFMKFLGGKDLLFALVSLVLLGITIFIFDKISYVFQPFVIIFNTIAAPIILSLILYYLLNPVINLMERYNIPRLLAIIIVFLVIIGGATLIIDLLIPVIGDQIKQLASNFPKYIEKFNRAIDKVTHMSILSSFYNQIQEWLDSTSKKIPSLTSDYFSGFGTKIRTFAEAIVNVGVVIATTPFVLFFMLKDGTKFRDYTTKIMPPKFRKDYHDLLEKMSVQVGSYIQGQIIVSFCIGILLFIAAVTSVVPYLGPTIAISPAIIIAIITSPFMLLKLIIVWTLVQFIEGHFISPNIMGKTLKIHPLTIIFILLSAGNLLGIVGVILGIPGYAILKVLASHIFLLFKRRYNKYYGDDAGQYEIKKEEHKDYTEAE